MPLDYGSNRHGSDMGPSAVRLAGLSEIIRQSGHQLHRQNVPMNLDPQEYEAVDNPKARYLSQVVAGCAALAKEVESVVRNGSFPLVIGGDHSIALGSLAGFAAAFREDKPRLGVIYIDAHGDFNTCETTLSGNIHGMCLGASCGYGIPELTDIYFKGRKIDPALVCYIGLRDLDPQEKILMKKAGVTAYTMSDIDRLGFTKAVQKVTQFIAEKTDIVHVSFDMDVIDPMFAPGVGVPLPGGLNYRESILLMEELYKTGKVRSAEIVEVNPVLDVRNQTAHMAVELIGRLLGNTIY